MRGRLSVLMFLLYGTQGAMTPLYTLRLQELGFSAMEIAWCSATSSLAALIGPMLAGQVADRWIPADRCLAFCGLACGVFLWLLGSADSFAAVFGLSLAFWLAMSPASTLCAALSFHHLPTGGTFGHVRLWGTIGWVCSGWLVGYWLSSPIWQRYFLSLAAQEGRTAELSDIFRLAGTLALALGVFAAMLPRTLPPKRHTSWLAPIGALRLLHNRNFVVYWCCSFGLCTTLSFSMQVTPLLLEHLGISEAWVSPTLTLGQSTEILALALLPMLLTRLEYRGTMLLGLGAWALYLAILMLGKPLWLVVASLSLNGVCICCFIVAGQVFVNSQAGEDVRASAQALLFFVNGVGMLLGSLLVGWVRRQVAGDFPRTFLVGAVMAATALLIFLVGFHRNGPAGAGPRQS